VKIVLPSLENYEKLLIGTYNAIFHLSKIFTYIVFSWAVYFWTNLSNFFWFL